MNKWQILIVKEIRHLFRDTKTIVQTVVVPTFITPLLIGAIVWYLGSVAQEESEKIYDLGYRGDTINELYQELTNSDRFNLSEYDDETALSEAITNDEIDIGLSNIALDNLGQNQLNIYFKDLDTFSQAKSLQIGRAHV